jgi:hypothetical protein
MSSTKLGLLARLEGDPQRPEATARDERAIDRGKAERLKGRRIVKAVPHAGWDVENVRLRRWIHSWRLHLDDGTIVSFATEETDHGSSYGTNIIFLRRKEPSNAE